MYDIQYDVHHLKENGSKGDQYDKVRSETVSYEVESNFIYSPVRDVKEPTVTTTIPPYPSTNDGEIEISGS